MRTWAKYLTIGWSIVTLAIVITSFQLLKYNFIEEDYEVTVNYKMPEKMASTNDVENQWEVVGESLFHGKDVFAATSITKKEFVDRIKRAKGITIETKNRVKENSVYILFPFYAFIIWTIPIIVFSLIGLLFSRKTETK